MKHLLTIFFLLLAVVALHASNGAVNLTMTFVNAGTNTYTGGCPDVSLYQVNETETSAAIATGLFLPVTPSTGEGFFGMPAGVAPGASSSSTALHNVINIAYAGSTGNLEIQDSSGNIVWDGPTQTYSDSASPDNESVTIFVDTDNCIVSTNPPSSFPVYTNFVVCLHNTLGVRANAQWTFNGVLEKSEVLTNGQSDCWTSPGIEVSPVPATANISTSVTPAAGNSDDPFGVDTNNQITFNQPMPSTTSSSVSGTNALGFTGGTNSIIASAPAEIAPSNLVTFPTPSGAASESTLQSGFQLLHQDNVNLLNGENILNNSVNTGFIMTTNLLGQEVALLTSNVEVDGQWLPRIYGAMTNPASLASSNISLTLSNFATESTLQKLLDAATNADVSGYPTNLLSTNGMAFNFPTNFDDGEITNILTGWTYVVDPTATNYQQALDATSGDVNENAAETMGTTFIGRFFDVSSGMQDYYPPVDMKYTFNY